jgi:hypothetical protein
VVVTIARVLLVGRLGAEHADGMDLPDWLLTPIQILASLTGGVDQHDPSICSPRGVGHWLARRTTLNFCPAGDWPRVCQEEPFIGRTGGHDDDFGSRTLAAQVARAHT